MFRSLVFAIGIFLLIFGAQTLIVDKWILSFDSPAPNAHASLNRSPYQNASFASARNVNRSAGYRNDGYYNQTVNSPTVKRVYRTKEWMPWSLLAAGTVIVLYSISTRPANFDR